MKSPSRGRKVLILLLLIPLLSGIAVTAWIHTVADRRWAAAQERIRELSAAFPPPKPRPPDETSSETAKEIQAMFVSAIRLAIQRLDRYQEVRRLSVLQASGSALDAVLRDVLDDASDILDRVHTGARRSVASPSEFPPSWRGEWDEDTLQYVVECCLLHSRRRRDLGKPDGAAEALLDGLPLVRFWGQSEAQANWARALHHLLRLHEELRVLLYRESLSMETLRQIEGELELSDDWLKPPFRRLEPQLARWSESLLSLQPEADGLVEGAPYRWRYLLPTSLMKAQAFEFMDHHTRALLSCEGKPYLDALRCDDAHWGEAERSLNPIIRRPDPLLGDPGWDALQRRAEVRLLRTAARYRATGEILQLEDPFGSVLLHSETREGMKFWSLGGDGTDEGGQDKGSVAWPRILRGGNTRDLVIEVPKWKRE